MSVSVKEYIVQLEARIAQLEAELEECQKANGEMAYVWTENAQLEAVVEAVREWCGGNEKLLPRRVARALHALEQKETP